MKVSKRFIFTLLTPASALYIIFFLLPLGAAFYYSLFDWSGIGQEMDYVGLDNYKELLSDNLFIASIVRTLVILFVGGTIIFGLAFVFTAMLNSGIKGRKFFRAIIFFPNVVATIALTTLWAYIYNPRGLLNSFLGLLGLPNKTPWTASGMIFGAMLVAFVWIYVGFYLVLLMAGTDKIPMEYYEAALLDGANQIQIFIKITIPLLWDVIVVAVVLWSIAALKIFEFPFAFTALEPHIETRTVAVHLYIMGFGLRQPIWRMGYASAIGVLLLLTVGTVVFLLRWVMRREVIQY